MNATCKLKVRPVKGSHHQRARILHEIQARDLSYKGKGHDDPDDDDDDDDEPDEDDEADEEDGDLDKAACESVTPAVVEQWIKGRN